MILNRNNFLRWDGSFTINESIQIIFQAVTNAEINTLQTSNPLTVSGLSGVKPISISGLGAQYQLNNGAWISTPGVIQNGDVLKVRGNSSLSYAQTNNVVVTISNSSGTFSITTKAASVINIQNSLSFTTIPASIRLSKNDVPVLDINDPAIQNYAAQSGDQIKVSSNSNVIPEDGFRKTEIIESGIPIFSKTETASNTPSEYIISVQDGKSYSVNVITGKNEPTEKRYFYLSQSGRKLSLTGPVSINCSILLSAQITVSTFDSSGNPTGTTSEFTKNINLGSGLTTAYNDGGNITAGPYDIINILSFQFSPETCDNKTVLVNGQGGIVEIGVDL